MLIFSVREYYFSNKKIETTYMVRNDFQFHLLQLFFVLISE